MPNRYALRRALIIYAVLALVLAFTLPPIVLSFLTSLKTMRDVYALPPKVLPTPFTLTSYAYSLAERGFASNLLHSAIVATAVTLVTLVVALPTGYGLVRFEFPTRRALTLCILFAYLLPAVGLLVPFYVIFSRLGLIDTYMALIIAHLVATVPFAVWFMRSYLNYVPWEVEEAARVDGCTRLGAVVRVILPLLKPAVLAIGFFSFITSWQEFVYALVFSGPHTATAPVVLATFVQETYVDWGGLAASTMVFSTPVAVLFLFLQRHLIAGLFGTK